ncbi:ribonuclease P protein component [Thalassolituus sp.]|jgi:ribonuclease P protein component|uniref:ribonuclease P protein component n=1 Tax=Thalassolituus sp. TaxID=2030822 RepID=UPI0026350C48|nr:ribonuclease P protein component [uncultured Thalassolituus sp.]
MPDSSFRKDLRLLKAAEFKRVFDNTALRGSTPHLLVLATPNGLEQPRVGFVLARKQLKKAVDRNRVKRLIRESFRQHQHDLEKNDFVILARSGIVELDNQQIRAMIDSLWFRLKQPHGKHPGRGRKKRR